ncbi:MAG: hypothetical protein J7524_18940 [Roseofilum sp. Belize BBD 4]|nr:MULTISPECIES: calcium-binding protein [unclassified Roseofilum]MBP0010762.1 hypothetical protein [Roseofilum sp. Belize Diploria]MBP0035223.1 hypothetical protein [Roseofilum sp. Belize BBD 4]
MTERLDFLRFSGQIPPRLAIMQVRSAIAVGSEEVYLWQQLQEPLSMIFSVEHPFSDLILGLEGNDSLYGVDDNDQIYGNQGVDLISANRGDDVVFGGQGNDAIFGGKITIAFLATEGTIGLMGTGMKTRFMGDREMISSEEVKDMTNYLGILGMIFSMVIMAAIR